MVKKENFRVVKHASAYLISSGITTSVNKHVYGTSSGIDSV